MNRIYKISFCAVFAAMYVVLALIDIGIGPNIRLSFGSLPIIIMSLLFGPAVGVCTALVGELLNQILTYGLTVTTPIWLLVPMIRAFIIGFGAKLYKKKFDKPIECRLPWLYVVTGVAAAATTFFNTIAIGLDAWIFGFFSWPYVTAALAIRFAVGIVTAIILSTISIPIVKAIKKDYGEVTL